jgi:hypothetical protein
MPILLVSMHRKSPTISVRDKVFGHDKLIASDIIWLSSCPSCPVYRLYLAAGRRAWEESDNRDRSWRTLFVALGI